MLQATTAAGPPSSLRILLAEDNLVSQKVALLMLQRIGYRAQVVTSGLDVLNALHQQPYDVILLDVQMPKMDGLETARQIKQQWPPEQCPRMIAMTASLLVEDCATYQDAGIDGYLSKPVQLEKLAALLRNCRPTTSLPSDATNPSHSDYASDPSVELPASEQSSALTESAAVTASLDLTLLHTLNSDIGNQSSLPLLIDCYLAEAPNLLYLIHQSATQTDAHTLRRAVHTLKSSSRSLGATALFHLCEELEELARGGMIDAVIPQLSHLEDEFKRFTAALQVAIPGVALQQERH
ncbi:MAG: response regulator [Synechococcales cyanobacterium C42_A2020_086]|jgi:CheY-like chemotaxis protein|nr:response regulator [Synechococcales cyanobacterium C42_A2020_086]